ncbi:MAG: hypothetical protein FJZ38_20705 [Candidatus Rokubacteria bacterium]|nr:hypothetical protein [Candidatus Rokubacteria bacterium]
MWALRHPAERAALPPLAGWTDARVVATLCAVAGVVAAAGVIPAAAAAVIAVGAVHGGMLAVALIWSGLPVARAAEPILLLTAARAGVAFHPLGALAYLVVPLWLAREARAGRLARLELGPPWPWGPVTVGALAGVGLALHLIACASRTLGYVVRVDASEVVPALAYDVGANVVSAELFFRGALLHHVWRRSSFALALASASVAAALRYCLDPFVATTELRVGAAVYMTMLAILNGVLCRWSGSLLPGLAAAAIFFACYRLLSNG